MDWFAILGNGTGVLFLFSLPQVDGVLYNTAYIAQLNQIANLELPGMVEITARNQGIFANDANGKTIFVRRMKQFIECTDATTYDFKTKFYYNSSLTQGAALEFIKNNNLNGLITHADTTELTSSDSEFIEKIL